MQIKIVKNNISDKLDEYQKRTGATKTWVAEKLEITKQRLYALCGADNMMLDVAIKFSVFFNCDIKDLFEYEVIDS